MVDELYAISGGFLLLVEGGEGVFEVNGVCLEVRKKLKVRRQNAKEDAL